MASGFPLDIQINLQCWSSLWFSLSVLMANENKTPFCVPLLLWDESWQGRRRSPNPLFATSLRQSLFSGQKGAESRGRDLILRTCFQSIGSRTPGRDKNQGGVWIAACPFRGSVRSLWTLALRGAREPQQGRGLRTMHPLCWPASPSTASSGAVPAAAWWGGTLFWCENDFLLLVRDEAVEFSGNRRPWKERAITLITVMSKHCLEIIKRTYTQLQILLCDMYWWNFSRTGGVQVNFFLLNWRQRGQDSLLLLCIAFLSPGNL